jgi:hypothetical protein
LRKVESSTLQKHGKLNVERTWRGERKRSASFEKQKREKKGKFPLRSVFFFLASEEEDAIIFFFHIFVSYLPPPHIFFRATVATKKATIAS